MSRPGGLRPPRPTPDFPASQAHLSSTERVPWQVLLSESDRHGHGRRRGRRAATVPGPSDSDLSLALAVTDSGPLSGTNLVT